MKPKKLPRLWCALHGLLPLDQREVAALRTAALRVGGRPTPLEAPNQRPNSNVERGEKPVAIESLEP